jgi:hypothetical protein
LPAAPPIFPLAIPMIEPPFRTLLVSLVGAPLLPPPRLFAAIPAAIAVSTVTRCANKKERLTLLTQAHSLPKNRFVLNRRHTL